MKTRVYKRTGCGHPASFIVLRTKPGLRGGLPCLWNIRVCKVCDAEKSKRHADRKKGRR